MLREAFYYLLGGITFLPLCTFVIVLHFYFNAPSIHASQVQGIEGDVELTQEKKLAALDLAAKNAALHAEIEKSKGKDLPQGDATAPPTAKRLGPGPSSSSSTKPFASGWLTVRSKFESDKEAAAANAHPPSVPATLVEQNTEKDASNAEGRPSDATESANAIQKAAANGTGYVTQMYRGILDYRMGRPATKKSPADQQAASASSSSSVSPTPTGTAGRENFFCILKAPILYLYSSDDVSSPNTECHAAIDLRGKRVSIYVSGLGDTLGDLESDLSSGTKPGASADEEEADESSSKAKEAWKRAKRATVRDGELFMKRNAIRIVGPVPGRSRSPAEGQSAKAGASRRRPQWYLFCKNNYVMEDWYHSLLQASLMPELGLRTKKEEADSSQLPAPFQDTDDPIGPVFSKEDMASLLVSLDSLPDPLPLRWLNALVGRIFFSVYRTAWLEDYITSKMMKKLTRVKTPGFLGDIKVEEVDIGRRAPGFSRPMLKALTSEGEASMEIAVHYTGELRITISTSLNLSLGSRFKPYNISLVLAVVLRSLEGNLLLHVKPPPSNRLWFGFTAMPKMEIDVEPVVSERKVQWGMVTRLIESRIRELLAESIVVPNMDDVPFFDTRSLLFRGGIFADAFKRAEAGVSAAATNTTPPADQSERTVQPSVGLKPSDAAALQNAVAKSAPASGAATPVLNDAEHEGYENDAMKETGDASSINSATRSDSALRNRKTGGVSSSLLSVDSSGRESSTGSQLSRITSPAAAGLSDLLSRDLAAGGGVANADRLSSGSPPRQGSVGSKRKTWFGAGPKLSGNSNSSSGLSAFGLGASALGGRNSREQSSLALGNASIERPINRSSSASIPDKTVDASAHSQPGRDPPIRATSESSSAPTSADVHRHKGSIGSTHSAASFSGTDESVLSADTDHLNDTLQAAAAKELQRDTLLDRVTRDATADEGDETIRQSGAPSVMISSASEPLLSMDDGPARAARASPLTISDVSRASALLNSAADYVDSPSSLAPSTRSSVKSLRLDQSGQDTAGSTIQQDTTLRSNSSIRETPSAASIRSNASIDMDKTLESNISSSISVSQRGPVPPPPPPRRPTATSSARDDKAQYRQDAASTLSGLQRDRYGLREANRDPTEEGGQPVSGPTSAMLLSSWNKAKASMADKESRQAAARDAKDAIKRGWASWNAKRAEAKRSHQQETEYADPSPAYDSITSSQSSRLSLVPGKSAWIASSPPDPTSFGLGFDKSSPEDTRLSNDNKHSLPARPPHARYNLGDTDDDDASIHSNSSSRQSYREHRATKTVHGFNGSELESDAGTHSSRSAMVSSFTKPSSTSGSPAMDRIGQWDAEIPSLAAPAPAFYEKEEQNSPEAKKKALDPAASSLARSLPSAKAERNGPPALPERKVSTSISSNAEGGGGVSFIPAAPSTTTSLASNAPFDAAAMPADLGTPTPGKEGRELGDHLTNTADASTMEPDLSQERVSDTRSAPNSTESVKGTRSDTTSTLAAVSSAEADTKTRQDVDTPSAAGRNKSTSPSERTVPLLASPKDEDQPSPTLTNKSDLRPAMASPSLGSGIKTQPGRAPMMAVPGIPSMQKASPQSFSAPPPPEELHADNSPSFRRTSLFKIPTLGSPEPQNSSASQSVDIGESANMDVKTDAAQHHNVN